MVLIFHCQRAQDIMNFDLICAHVLSNGWSFIEPSLRMLSNFNSFCLSHSHCHSRSPHQQKKRIILVLMIQLKVNMRNCGTLRVSPSLHHPRLSVSSFNNNNNNNRLDVADDANYTTKQSTGADAFKWRLVIAYDGTRYAGWQFQQSPPTIQCIVEKALVRATKLERKDLHLVGASRTDTGVHAWGQVAHFVTPFNYDSLDSIHAALNGLLPPDIRVREISPALAQFHARFSARSKIYHYKIYNDSIMDPFQRQYACHTAYRLNAAAMRQAAQYFIGKHDFSAFANASRNDRVPDPVKTIYRFDVIEMGALLQLEVEGTGFLYRQVRNMVALLLQIGKEAIPPEIVPKILATRDRKELAKYTLSAPPHGLCLVAVNYTEEQLRLPADCPAISFGRHRSIGKCKLPLY